MSPALAARVQTAVSGNRSHGISRRNPVTGALRVLTFVLLLASVVAIVRVRDQRAAELEAARSSVLQRVRNAAAQLTREDRELKERAQAAIALHAVPAYAGDYLADELRTERGLVEALSLATLYIRGPLDGLASAARLPELAAGSFKDPLVLCLLDPPEARTEKVLR